LRKNSSSCFHSASGFGVIADGSEELTRLLQKPFLLFGALFCNVITPLAFLVAVSLLMNFLA
jgi:hypothetical protein